MSVLSTDEYFNQVYEATIKAVSRYVVSKCGDLSDVEDILQNVYSRFYQRISKKGYEDIESAEAFLVNIAKFECKTFFTSFTKIKNRFTHIADFSDEEYVKMDAELSKSQKSLEDVLCNEMLAKQIFEDIAKTDELTGKIFYLHFACDMKLEEIANELGLKLSTVKSKLYRMLERQKTKYGL